MISNNQFLTMKTDCGYRGVGVFIEFDHQKQLLWALIRNSKFTEATQKL